MQQELLDILREFLISVKLDKKKLKRDIMDM